jgi:pimeloyl-ACP methyl ester carboxylesterase
MPQVKVNDIEMYYEVHGEGEPLLMLHGFGRTGASYKSFIPEYKKHFRLIIPDQRGRGRTTNPTKAFTRKQSASDIFELLENLKVEKFNAIGSSSGGMTLLHMAIQQTERINKLVLVCTSPYITKQAREIQTEMSKRQASEEEWEFMRSIHHLGDEQILKIKEEWENQADSYEDMNFTPPYLSTINSKTLILHGDRDEFFPVHIPVLLHDSIPDSYLCILPNTMHSIISGVHSETARKIVLDFLRDKWVDS